MLSFKIKQSGALQVYLDQQGLEQLIRMRDGMLTRIFALRRMGANALDEKTPFGDEAIGEVIIDWEGDDEEG